MSKPMTLNEIEELFLEKREQYPNIILIDGRYGISKIPINGKNIYVPSLMGKCMGKCCFVGFCLLGEIATPTMEDNIFNRTWFFEIGLVNGFDNHAKISTNKQYLTGYRFGQKMRKKYLEV